MSFESRFKYLIKNMGILTICNFASKIMVFLLVPMYTSVLTTSEYGTYDLLVSTMQLLFPILTLNITDAVMRFSMDKSKDINDVVRIGLKYIINSFWISGLFLLLSKWFDFFQDIDGIEFIVFWYYFFYVSNQFLIQLAKGMERVSDMGIAGVISTVILLGCNILFLLCFNLGLTGFFAANILSQAIPAIYFFIRLKVYRYFNISKIDAKLRREMLIYCFPLIFTTVGWWVNNASDKYVVVFIWGTAANGILSVSYKIPSIINTLQGIFIQAWQISAIKEYGSKETEFFYGKMFCCINFMMCIVCSVLIMLSKPLANILYSNDFYIAWKYVPLLLIASVINSASGFLGPILAAAKDSKNMAWSAIYGAGTNLIMNIVLVYTIGIQGATIATVISSYIIYFVRKEAVKNKMVMYKWWEAEGCWIILCIQAGVEIFTLSHYIQILFCALIVLLNFNIITQVINKFKKF